MPAQKISSKLSGRPKGRPSSRATGTGTIISPSDLGKISLDRDAVQALALASAKVNISISSGGTIVQLVSETTGAVIGGVDDLTKLLSLRSFVAKEKKATASSDTRDEIALVAFNCSTAAKVEEREYVQQKLDNSYIVATKPYVDMLTVLNTQETSVVGNANTDTREISKEILLTFIRNFKVSVNNVLLAVTKGEKEKGLLEAELFKNRVPLSLRGKLGAKSYAIPADMELSTVLFPRDPAKGLALSVREWRDPGFVSAMGPLMRSSKAIALIVQSEELLLLLSGLTAEKLVNAEDPHTQRVMKTRILVVPPFEDKERVLGSLAKPNFKGFNLPVTAMDESKDRLVNLCSVWIRAYAFSVRMADTKGEFWDTLFPAGTILPVDDKLGNFAKQAFDTDAECNLYRILRLEASPEALLRWIVRECKLSIDGAIGRLLKTTLGITNVVDVPTPESVGLVDRPVTSTAVVEALAEVEGPVLRGTLKEFRKKYFPSKKEGKKAKAIAASALSDEAKAFVTRMKRDRGRGLADSMDAYFRGFYSLDIQRAAVRIASARFDDIEEEEKSSSDESSSDDDDSDSD